MMTIEIVRDISLHHLSLLKKFDIVVGSQGQAFCNDKKVVLHVNMVLVNYYIYSNKYVN